ncbi:MAG: hypothetical protein WBB73_04770 [Candidatus Aminicenantaceae bacterium]
MVSTAHYLATQAGVRILRNGGNALDAAAAAPRIHCSYNGKVSLEAAYMRDDIPSELLSRGFDVEVREPMSFYLGCIQMVLRQNENYIGVADPRRDGSAAGPKA